MNGPVLTLFAILVAALLAIGAAGLIWPRHMRPVAGLLAGLTGGLAAMLALAVVLLPGPPALLPLPVGLPGGEFLLAIDPLSGGFLLLVSIAGTAALVFGAEAAPKQQADPAPILAVALAGLLLAVLAADGVTLALGIALGGGAIWAAGADAAAPSGHRMLAVLALAAGASVLALGLLSPTDSLQFAAARTIPAGPLRAGIAVLVAIAGLGALFGLAPLHGWMVPAHGALPPPAAALLSGGMLPTVLYTLSRILLDLSRSASPLVCGIPLLLAGTVSVLWGGYQACRSGELDSAVVYGSIRQSGLAAFALGLVALGRGADLPNVAAMALSAVILLAAMQAICGTLAQLSAGAIRQQAGTRRLDRLGGLSKPMPVSTAGLVVGLGGLAGFPPAPGFAALFLLFQAELAGPRSDGLGRGLLLVALVLVLALSSGLAITALVRLAGMACLGRPRVPRTAAAEEVPSAARPALYTLLGLTCLLGLLPGPLVLALDGGAIHDLTGAALADHIGWLTLAPGAASPGYAPIPIALLFGVVFGAALWWRRRLRATPRSVSLWQDGFAGAPPWLPFGDPLTQWNGAALPPVLPARLRTWSRSWLRRARRDITAPALALIAAGLLLALLAWPGRP